VGERDSLITPTEYVGGISQLLYDHEAKVGATETSAGREARNESRNAAARTYARIF
jgi:hypothetical protein